METNQKQQEPLIIIPHDKQPDIKSTSAARGLLYRLIAHFRKNAEKADDPRTISIFRFASEELISLAHLFKQYEQEVEDQQPQT